MGEAGTIERSVRARALARARPRTLAPGELAWVVALPCALVTLIAILLLGPAVGHALIRPLPPADGLWPPDWAESTGRPEPVELGRFLVAAAAPALAAIGVLVLARRRPALPASLIRPLVLASQALVTVFLVLTVLGQHEVLFDNARPQPPFFMRPLPLPPIFGTGALLGAAVVLVVGLVALPRPGVTAQLARLARETPLRRHVGVACALLVSVPWLIEGLVVDGAAEDRDVLAWTLDDAFAVLGGHTPLVDYHVLYSKLLPYPAALAMAAFGSSALVYGLLMLALSALTLLAVYGIFRRIVGSSLLALGLLVPFLALGDIHRPMSLTSMWPMRYGGAYLMAWLVARNVQGGRSRIWVLCAIGAVVTVNEMEFGAAALAASLVALACARPPRTRRAAARFVLDAAGGVLAGLALVTLFTLLRAGELPHPALLEEWPRIFTRLGWFSLPMPTMALHLALYVTFAAVLLVAAVRLARGADDVLLTSMLAWSGVFGLLAAGYFTGRSDELKLVSLFSAWAFALMLLLVVVARALAVQGWRSPTAPQLLVLFGFALAVCSVARPPSPERELTRLLDEPPATYRPRAERFIGAQTRPHERVAILMPMGHRFAYDLGLDNVFPYATQDALVTRWQLGTTLAAIRRAHVHRVFLDAQMTAPAQLEVLQRAGFRPTAQSEELVALGDGPPLRR